MAKKFAPLPPFAAAPWAFPEHCYAIYALKATA